MRLALEACSQAAEGCAREAAEAAAAAAAAGAPCGAAPAHPALVSMRQMAAVLMSITGARRRRRCAPPAVCLC